MDILEQEMIICLRLGTEHPIIPIVVRKLALRVPRMQKRHSFLVEAPKLERCAGLTTWTSPQHSLRRLFLLASANQKGADCGPLGILRSLKTLLVAVERTPYRDQQNVWRLLM
jgi:hypothetical protein